MDSSMVDIEKMRMTVEEFDTFVQLSENSERLFEYIGGEIVEVPSNPYSSYIAARILGYLIAYVEANNLGFVTGADGGYMVGGQRYAPDVAFISKEKQTELPYCIGYNLNPPDLAVEVVSPTDKNYKIATKINTYLLVGTVVWLVEPEDKLVVVYTSQEDIKEYGIKDTIEGGEVLPNFTLKVSEIFPKK